MAEREILLRDERGQEHRVTRGGEGALSVGGVEVTIRVAPDGSLLVRGAGQSLLWAVASGRTAWVFVDGRVFTFDVDRPARRTASRAALQGPITAPMPAIVRTIAVAPGDSVRPGDVLIVLEAMKMELPVRASVEGLVEAVNCREGDMVQPGQELVTMAGDDG